MYIVKCIDCQKETEFKYKARFEKINHDMYKCRRCRQLVLKNCEICQNEFISWINNDAKTCSDKCKFEWISLKLSNGQYSNVSQIPTIKEKITEKGRYFSRNIPAGENNPMYGKKHSPQTKRLQRIKRLEELESKLGAYPGYNPESISIIEEYGKKHGYNFQHAENGGEYFIRELGYYVDGYDVEKNVVIEYDEPHHYLADGSLRPRDVYRQNEIQDFLKCHFIRIKK